MLGSCHLLLLGRIGRREVDVQHVRLYGLLLCCWCLLLYRGGSVLVLIGQDRPNFARRYYVRGTPCDTERLVLFHQHAEVVDSGGGYLFLQS